MLSCRCLRLLACIAAMLGAVVLGAIAKWRGGPDEFAGGPWFEYPMPEAAAGVRVYVRRDPFLLLRIYLRKNHDWAIQYDPRNADYIVRDRDGIYPGK